MPRAWGHFRLYLHRTSLANLRSGHQGKSSNQMDLSLILPCWAAIWSSRMQTCGQCTQLKWAIELPSNRPNTRSSDQLGRTFCWSCRSACFTWRTCWPCASTARGPTRRSSSTTGSTSSAGSNPPQDPQDLTPLQDPQDPTPSQDSLDSLPSQDPIHHLVPPSTLQTTPTTGRHKSKRKRNKPDYFSHTY